MGRTICFLLRVENAFLSIVVAVSSTVLGTAILLLLILVVYLALSLLGALASFRRRLRVAIFVLEKGFLGLMLLFI